MYIIMYMSMYIIMYISMYKGDEDGTNWSKRLHYNRTQIQIRNHELYQHILHSSQYFQLLKRRDCERNFK